MQLVRVKNVSKRLERPSVLTAEEFHKLLLHVREPYRTMVLIAGCLGLRASEIVGLQWRDFDFQKSTLLVQRGVVHGRVDDVKTEYSRDAVPIAPELVKELMEYRSRCYPTEEGWLFPNPLTGKPITKRKSRRNIFVGPQRRRRSSPKSDGRRSATALDHGSIKPTRRTDWSADRTNAPYQHSNDNECLRQGNDGQQEAGRGSPRQ